VNLADGIAKVGAALPWHWAQLLLVLGAYAWMFVSVGSVAKLLVVWQLAQVEDADTGIWFDGIALAPTSFHGCMTEWHALHSAVVGM
jgi:hypothetical protein